MIILKEINLTLIVHFRLVYFNLILIHFYKHILLNRLFLDLILGMPEKIFLMF